LAGTHKDLSSPEQTLPPAPNVGAAVVNNDEPHGILGHDTTDRKTMIASKESESPNIKDGDPVADEETADTE
jgi:hypothetical protein